MKDLRGRIPFLWMLIPLLVGIFSASLFDVVSMFFLIPLLIISLLPCLRGSRSQATGWVSGVSITFFFVVLGFTLAMRDRDSVVLVSGDYYQVTILERPYFKNSSFRAEAMLTAVLDGDTLRFSREKVMLYFPGEWEEEELPPGTRMVIGSDPQEITNRGNPFEFDYRRYASAKGFYRQFFMGRGAWETGGADPRFRIRVAAEKARDHLLSLYQRNGIGGKEFEILSALTLGYKKSLDNEIRELFSSTGASHVLAVSGLHTGIVYLILLSLLGFMRKGRVTRIFFLVIVLAALWGFAFITGLAPSVKRSVLMFTVVMVGENLRKPANIYNTVAASAFLLLISDTRLLNDVGFQLSYAAVTGIIFFQPRISGWFSFRNRVARYFWELISVSLASQITTFPITCFYFHQFPVYFWVANLIVIPAAFLFLSLGILILATSFFLPISTLLARLTVILIRWVYSFLEVTGNLPGAVIPGIGFPVVSLVMSFLILFMCMLFLVERKAIYLLLILFFGSVMFLSGAYGRFQQAGSCEIIAYNRREPLIHLIQGYNNYLLVPEENPEGTALFMEAEAVIREKRLKKPVVLSLSQDFSDLSLVKRGNLFTFGGILVGLMEKGAADFFAGASPDVLLLWGNATLSDSFHRRGVVVSYRRGHFLSGERMVHVISSEGAWLWKMPKGE